MEIGSQMQNHKIETNSELIYEDGSIWSTLIFIKIIGSYTLWFPLPPSEVLSRGSGPVLLRNPLSLWFSRGGGGSEPPVSSPLDPRIYKRIILIDFKRKKMTFISACWSNKRAKWPQGHNPQGDATYQISWLYAWWCKTRRFFMFLPI